MLRGRLVGGWLVCAGEIDGEVAVCGCLLGIRGVERIVGTGVSVEAAVAAVEGVLLCIVVVQLRSDDIRRQQRKR